VQFSAAFGISCQDFNNDGWKDLFFAQNFFQVSPESSPLSSGKGLMLRGRGDGKFTALTPRESGIDLDGEQRATAWCDFDHDGDGDLVVSQNGAATKLFRNKNKIPGAFRIRLIGAPGNESGIGCRVTATTKSGQVWLSELQAGSGYWSQDSRTQLLPKNLDFSEVVVRWPDGGEQRSPRPKEDSLDWVIQRQP
jgi:hypothetical protein